MAKNVLLIAGLTLLYIFLLTVIFENFINKPSSTLLTILAFILFFILSLLYVQFIIKKIRNRFK